MSRFDYGWKAAGVALILLLNACQDPPARPSEVDTIVADPAKYLSEEFTPAKNFTGINDALARLDSTPVGFQTLVVDNEFTSDPPVEKLVRNRHIYRNAGNGLVQELVEESEDGELAMEDFYLSYRGFLFTRSQRISVKRSVPPVGGRMTFLPRADAFSPNAATDAEFQFDEAYGPMSMLKPPVHRVACRWGAVRPAASLFPAFSGDARDFDCRHLDPQGVVVFQVHRVYLLKYGIALQTRAQASDGVTTTRITNATMD